MQMMIADNEDLLIEILLWLPAKSLIRFKLVCKRWLSLISRHRFSCLHTLHHGRRHSHRPEPSILLRLADLTTYFYVHGQDLVSFRTSPTLFKPTICSSSNGLFLLQCRSVEDGLYTCYVYNPATKESRKIPLNLNERYCRVLGLNIAFDPMKSRHYKIVCVRAAKRRTGGLWRSWWRRCLVEVYDSETSMWKLCGEPFVTSPHVQFDDGVYWNNGIHWDGTFYDLENCVIGEHPEVVVAGNSVTDDLNGVYVESNDHLHYVAHSREGKSVAVFELQRDYSQWCLKYRVNLDQAPGPLWVLSVVRGESEEDSSLMVHQPGKIMVYKFQEKSFIERIDFSKDEFYREGSMQFTSRGCFQITETLAPV